MHDRTTPLNLPIAVVVIDIDNFNWINEEYGYENGNALIVEFSQRLVFSAPPHSLAARIEGNKFALAIPGTYSSQEVQTMLSEQFFAAAKLFSRFRRAGPSYFFSRCDIGLGGWIGLLYSFAPCKA
ncbi:diguanylate cyclase [Domibacillus sp. A3M-37]|nr:diguanylate cyclase [Domibacillus sp. A3M-37]